MLLSKALLNRGRMQDPEHTQEKKKPTFEITGRQKRATADKFVRLQA